MSDSALATSFRTHLCGALRDEHVGASVRLGGWVHRSRDLGGLVFFDLRDRAGLVQVSFDLSQATPEVAGVASSLGAETVVLVEGIVAQRPEAMRNAELSTGDVEVRATALRVLGPAETPVIPVARGKGEQLAAEELRLRHRYLDLRRDELQRNLVLRHRLMQTTRRYLSGQRLLRDRDADAHEADARRRARLPRAEPRASRASSTRCRSRRRSTSSCSWSRATTATSRSRAASATRTCAPTGSRSSRRSTSRRRSSREEDVMRDRRGADPRALARRRAATSRRRSGA